MGCYEAPGKHQAYQSVQVLPDRIIHRGAKREKKKENRKGTKVKSWSPTALAAKCSHCNLISMSRRIDTCSAISRKAIYYAFTKRELRMGPEDR